MRILSSSRPRFAANVKRARLAVGRTVLTLGGSPAEFGDWQDLLASWAKLLIADIFRPRVVMAQMRGRGHQFQILYSIIKRVVIFVMNDFRCEKRPSEMLFHGEPVFKHRLAIDRKDPIALACNRTRTFSPVDSLKIWPSVKPLIVLPAQLSNEPRLALAASYSALHESYFISTAPTAGNKIAV